jgi:acetolactate synthase-1/2/3 large subunit
LGVAGLGSKDHVTEAFEKADLVLAIGYDLIEWPPERWNPKQDKAIIHMDFEPAEVDNHYRADVEVVADIADSLWKLNQRTSELPAYDMSDFTHIRDHILYEVGLQELASQEHTDIDTNAADLAKSDAFPLKPQRIIKDLRSALGDADILISDVGAHKMWVARHYPAYLPSTCIISNGFCSMGIAVPGAISAKLIRPDRRVVGLCGDGGFLMNVQELATAVQYKIPCTIMVWEDGGYGLIKWKQENQFGRHSHTDFINPDLAKLAESFGAWAMAIDSADQLSGALEEAFAIDDKPSVIIVPVDYSENRKLTKRLGKLVAH